MEDGSLQGSVLLPTSNPTPFRLNDVGAPFRNRTQNQKTHRTRTLKSTTVRPSSGEFSTDRR
eukprot:scaffold9673_cov108-Cylindrotheca_fusiformis.AAC.4